MAQKPCTIALVLIALLLFSAGQISAQGTTSRVTGTVTDGSGSLVAGATVTLTNEGTGLALTAQTSDAGAYVFDLIQIGKYQITVEKTGFKKFVSPGNTVNINQPATVNVTLQVGDVSAVVTVENAANEVQTSSSGNIGSTVEQRTLESLPIVGLRGRNPLDLLNFQPGVVFGGNTGGAVNVHGSRDRAFNFTLDGIDINESTAGGSNFTPLRTNPDSVQEFQIVTSNFTAELGRSSGAQVTLVTRSGTNRFNGNAFDYYQTPDFNAKTYPITIAGLPKEQFVQHIFGGSVGGPIIKDRLFYFANLQILRAYDTALVTRTVYTQSARNGLFRYVAGRANAPAGTATPSVDTGGNAVLPACVGAPPTNAPCINSYNIATNPSGTGIDSTLQGIINSSPLPNNFTVGDGLNTAGFNFASPQHEKQYDFVTKFDFKLNDKNNIYARYAQGEQNSLGDSGNGGRPIFPDSPNFVDTFRAPKNFAANWRYSPTPKIANEFIFGVSTFRFDFLTPKPDPNIPFTFLDAIATPNTNFSYNARGVRTLQFIDNVTFDLSPHTIKTGVNFRFNRHTDDRSNVGGSAIEPVVTFGSGPGFAAFALPAAATVPVPTGINSTDLTRLQATINNLLGRIGTVSQAFVSDPNNPAAFAAAGTRWENIATYPELDFYVQDNWRFRPNLVFDLGVRVEGKLTPQIDGRPMLVPDQPVGIGHPASSTLKWTPGDVFKDNYSVLPSVGFAWDPFKKGKTSIRANYRMSSDRAATFLFGSFIFQSTPGNNIGVTNSTFGQGGGLYRNLGPVYSALAPTQTPESLRQPAAFGTGSISAIDRDFRFPEIHSWSISYQQEFWEKNVFEVNYIWKHGVHLLGGYNANQVDIFTVAPGLNESFLSAWNTLRTGAPSPLINALMSGNPANNNGSARFRTIVTQNNINLNNIGAAAQTLSQRTCQADDITAGICTVSGRRLVSQGGYDSFLQKYSQFTGGFNIFDSNDYSNYQAVEMIFKRRISRGLGFQFAYTWSKSKDNRSWDPSLSGVSAGSVQAASSTPFDLRDRNLNYAWSDFDRRHVFQGTYVWEIPFGKDRWLSSKNKIVDYVLGGWQLAGTAIWQSGRPFTVFSGVTSVGNVVQSTANCISCTRDIGSLILETGRNFWFDSTTRALFGAPVAGSIGNTGRNFFIAPRYFQTNASLSKKFKFTERFSFDLRLDATNLTNNPSFDNPTAVINSTIFGRINDSVTNTARRMQLSGKFSF